jgi:hypothetical protein
MKKLILAGALVLLALPWFPLELQAQGLYMGLDGRAHPQVIAGPNGSVWPVTPTFCPLGWSPCPIALGPPIPLAPPAPPALPLPVPPAAYAPPPPPPPLGWVFYRYAPCASPDCGTLVVQVGADGLNVRAAPAGFGIVLLALANGTPILPIQRSGDWVLVAAACPLAPTYTYSITAGVPLSVCS